MKSSEGLLLVETRSHLQSQCWVGHALRVLSPPQRFPGVFQLEGGEEQARAINILEDWGREW